MTLASPAGSFLMSICGKLDSPGLRLTACAQVESNHQIQLPEGGELVEKAPGSLLDQFLRVR